MIKHIYGYSDKEATIHTVCDSCKGSPELDLDWDQPEVIETPYALCEICRKTLKTDLLLNRKKINLSISISVEQANELRKQAKEEGVTLSELILRKL